MKHSLKAILAASAVALAAGSAHAATYTFDTTWNNTIFGCNSCTGLGSGTGTFDTATNVITISGLEHLHIAFDGLPASDADITRTYTIDTDGANGASAPTLTYVTTLCGPAGAPACASPAQAIGATVPFGSLIYTNMAVDHTGVAFVWNMADSIQAINGTVNMRDFAFTNVQLAPAVPVPAAAWLFGSGLLGLAGTARKRKQA
ncbi:MAG: VPLPA-CTERM sorting domain-containing protein [Spongiibacteraceae bacterium]